MSSLKKTIVLSLLVLYFSSKAFAFCGFYVAKADTKIFNKASQVILARDKNKTIITMSNDFQGKVKDFAMVVPVPMVLQEKDIQIVDRNIFDKLDASRVENILNYLVTEMTSQIFITDTSADRLTIMFDKRNYPYTCLHL